MLPTSVCLGLVVTGRILSPPRSAMVALTPPAQTAATFSSARARNRLLTNQINWTLRSSVLGPRPGPQPVSQYTGRGFRIHLLTKDSTTVGGNVHPFRLLVSDLCRLTFYVTCLVLLPASPSVMHSCHLTGFTWTNAIH